MPRRLHHQVLLFLLLALLLDGVLQHQLSLRHKSEQIAAVSLRLSALRAQVEKELTGDLLLVQGAAEYAGISPGLTEQQFGQYVRSASASSSLLSAISLAPGGVVAFTHPRPLEGYGPGSDLRTLPSLGGLIRQVADTDQLAVAGPLPLEAGGQGLFAMAPVHRASTGGPASHGYVFAVIDVHWLTRQAGFGELSDLDWAVRGRDGLPEAAPAFLGPGWLFRPDAEAVVMPVSFPSGSWELAAVPRGGWGHGSPWSLWAHLGVALLAVLASLDYRRFMLKSNETARAHEKLARAQRLARMGSWELDPERDGIWWSDEMYQLHGRARGSFTPTVEILWEWVHPEDKERVTAAWNRARASGEGYSQEYRMRLGGGDYAYLSENGMVETGEDGRTLWVGTVRDMTESRQAQAALRNLKSRYDRLTSKLQDRMVFFTYDATGAVRYLSEGAMRLAGVESVKAIGRHWHDLVDWTPASLARAEAKQELLMTNEAYFSETEMSFNAADGSLRTLALYSYSYRDGELGEPLVEGVAIDISGQKDAEAEVRILTSAIENAPASVVIADTTGAMLYVNPCFTRVTGYAREEVLGHDLTLLDSGKHEDGYFERMWEDLRSGRVWHGEMLNKKKNGALFWESASISPIFDDTGRVSACVAVKADITDRKKLERMREDVDRMMRHDLKTPLNAIIGLPQLLEMDGNLTEEQLELLKAIKDSGRRMLDMIELSLDMARIETGNYNYAPTLVDALAVVARLAEQHRLLLFDGQLALRVLVEGREPAPGQRFLMLAEERLLYPLLSNLFINAVEASPPGGDLVVSMGGGERQTLCLRNTGAVPGPVRAQFFAKYRTHGKQYGTGLGTYSAKLLATAMRYEITMATSDEENLTSVCITAPKAAA